MAAEPTPKMRLCDHCCVRQVYGVDPCASCQRQGHTGVWTSCEVCQQRSHFKEPTP